MAPRQPQKVSPSFTKGEVNRTGKLMLVLRERMRDEGDARSPSSTKTSTIAQDVWANTVEE